MHKNILITGGIGYIGSHTAIEMLSAGYKVLLLDNLSNSSMDILKKMALITNKDIPFIKGDIRDDKLLTQVFSENNFDAVIHCAGLKSVTDSLASPLEYYDNNVFGTLSLCRAMQKTNVRCLVFSSSATVYGSPERVPIIETDRTEPNNPYGHSKLMIETLLNDLVKIDDEWSIALLRYFNPVGAHYSGLLGEKLDNNSGNLIPKIANVFTGHLSRLPIFGADYPTRDGTGIRDYIHVIDLVLGHLKALEFLKKNQGIHTWNLGTGQGYSVFEIVKSFEKIVGVKIPYEVLPRRTGDIAECWSDPSKATRELHWHAAHNLEEMLSDTWRWIKNSSATDTKNLSNTF